MPVALAFAVLGIGGTATSPGLVLLAGTLAGLISYLVAGVWADLSRRTLMLAADAVRLIVEAAVAVLLLTGVCQHLAARAGQHPGLDRVGFRGSGLHRTGGRDRPARPVARGKLTRAAAVPHRATGNLTPAFAIFMVLGPVLALRRLGGASGWGLVSSGMTAGPWQAVLSPCGSSSAGRSRPEWRPRC